MYCPISSELDSYNLASSLTNCPWFKRRPWTVYNDKLAGLPGGDPDFWVGANENPPPIGG
ncbi:hypothetical protein DCC35_12335 [Mangrovivirga cuniculi]|uniref:Uncharacterized protein n=1 Tax=Mangrovivirga cuniculi TaxID=2715131 RepID=A0A4D7JXM2_9BACT|nr:hypothetical protein DCC35_12335 [Mangrovivirga cuniculi]